MVEDVQMEMSLVRYCPAGMREARRNDAQRALEEAAHLVGVLDQSVTL